MPADFFVRLRDYYLEVAKVLRGEADSAKIFPNTTDKGIARERVYIDFLRQHSPSKCNIFSGGFLFDEDGKESRQLDVIVTTDTAPRFDMHNAGGAGKSFSPVEGTLCVASIKSTLDKKELLDSLDNLASIPPTRPLGNRIPFNFQIPNYDDWPLKIVYASDGIAPQTLMDHLIEFYKHNDKIPLGRRPNFVHVAGKYVFARNVGNTSLRNAKTGEVVPANIGEFQGTTAEPDLSGIVLALNQLQIRAAASTHILYSYADLINRVIYAENPLPPNSAQDASHQQSIAECSGLQQSSK